MAESHQNCNCVLNPTVASVHQTLSEMDFERGIWNAVIYNEVKKVKDFIASGKAMDKDNTGYTALHYAARSGNEEICGLLIAGKADVNAATNGGCTSLHRASSMGHLHIVQLLLNNKANVFLQDDDGQTALHRAAAKNNFPICRLLLDSSSDRNLLISLRDHRHRLAFDLLPVDANVEIKKLFEI
ncbi:ANKRD39 family protein [Megaselia abdita]